MSISIHTNNGVFSKNAYPHNPFNLIGENGAYHLSAKPLCTTIQFRNGGAITDIQIVSPTSTPKIVVFFYGIKLGLMGINVLQHETREMLGGEEDMKRRWRGGEEEVERKRRGGEEETKRR